MLVSSQGRQAVATSSDDGGVSFAAVLASVMFKDWLFPAGLASDEAIRDAIADFTIDGIGANAPPEF